MHMLPSSLMASVLRRWRGFPCDKLSITMGVNKTVKANIGHQSPNQHYIDNWITNDPKMGHVFVLFISLFDFFLYQPQTPKEFEL